MANTPKFCFFISVSVFFTGCTASQYAEKADKEVYSILSKVEKDLFGSDSGFSIDTKLSDQDPSQVSAAAILKKSTKGERVKLNIDQAINYAIEHSREYQSEKERLYLTALTLTGERNNFKPRLFGRSRADYTRLSDGELQSDVNSSVGVNNRFKTGGALGITIANDLLRFFTGDPRRSATSLLSLNVLQPLLRGAGKSVAAENLTQANRNVIYAVRDFSHFQNTFSVNVVNQYFDLLQLKDTVYNEYSNYLSRKANAEYLRARVDREKPSSIGDAEQSVLVAKDRYLRAVTNYKNSIDRFKIVLGIPQTTKLQLDDSEIKRVRSTGVQGFSISNAEAFRIALANRLPLFNQIDRFEDSKRRVGVAANRLKADLNIIGNASLANSGGPTDYTQFNFKDIRANVGLELDLPLDRLRERNEYRTTLINFESATRRLSRDFDELRNLLDRRIRELEQFRQTYEIQKNAVELAKRRVEGNELRLKAGTVIFRRLSESQDALIAAQNAETEALVNYLEGRLNLLIDLGVIRTDQKRYWLKKNPSKLKAFNRSSSTKSKSDNKLKDEIIPPNQLFR